MRHRRCATEEQGAGAAKNARRGGTAPMSFVCKGFNSVVLVSAGGINFARVTIEFVHLGGGAKFQGGCFNVETRTEVCS